MSDVHLADTGTVATVVAVLGAVGTGLVILFRAAYRIGVEARTNERIASDLTEIKSKLEKLIGVEARVGRLEDDVKDLIRRSRLEAGE